MRPLFLLVCFFSIPALAQTTAAGSTPGSFRVTEAGAAEYRIPLRVPPGIAGLEPKLALVYNSQAGNGLLGVGWSLEGLSAITRCPRTLAQDGVRGGVNYDANDRFCLDGQRLMAVSGAYGADGTQYRTERETFTKVISEGAVASLGNGPLKFKAWTKSGQVIEYGYTEDSRIQAQGKQTVRAWAVNKVSDTKGNYFTVTYSEDNANGDYRPDRIDYAGNAGFAPAGSVQFSYEPRSDIELALVAGSVIRSTARLSMIKTFGGVAAVREYRLTYDPVVPPARSRMSSVQECAGSVECLVATTLSWGAGASGSFVHWTNASVARGAVNHYEHYFADVNGDGKADWIQVARGGDLGWVGLANGDGSFQHWTSSSNVFGAALHYVHFFADLNGDGKADWVQIANGCDCGWVGLSNGDGTFRQPIFTAMAGAFHNYAHYFADVDGDGRADWIQVARGGDLGWVGLSNGDGTFQHWTNASAARGAVDNFAHYFADVNGDGKADWIQVARGGDLGWVGLAVAAAPDRLLLVADGAGRTTSVAYRPLTDDSVYAKDVGANAASYPTMDLQAPIYVVSSMSATNGAGGALSTTFSYGGLKASHDGRGALGFRWQESVELSTDLKVRIENRQDWPYVGLPSLVRRTQISGAVLSQTLNSYGSAGPAMGVYFPFVSQTVETGNDLNGAALPEVTTSRRYDGFGNPTSIEVDSGGGYLKSTTNIFDEPDTEKWLLQRLLRSTVQSTSP
jgi:hypothetical protein